MARANATPGAPGSLEITIAPSGDRARVRLQGAFGSQQLMTRDVLTTDLARILSGAPVTNNTNDRKVDLLAGFGMVVIWRDHGPRLVWFLSGREHTLRFNGYTSAAGVRHHQEWTTQVPDTIWAIDFSSRGLCTMAHMGIATQRPLRTSVACIAPWRHGNVYRDGHVCWGALQQQVNGMRIEDPHAIPNLFFSSPFNTDLADPGCAIYDCEQGNAQLGAPSGAGRLSVDAWLDQLYAR